MFDLFCAGVLISFSKDDWLLDRQTIDGGAMYQLYVKTVAFVREEAVVNSSALFFTTSHMEFVG